MSQVKSFLFIVVHVFLIKYLFTTTHISSVQLRVKDNPAFITLLKCKEFLCSCKSLVDSLFG